MKVIRFFWRKMVFLLTHYDIDSMINLIFKLFIKSPIIRINTVFFKEIAIKNHSFYHEFTTFERALI